MTEASGSPEDKKTSGLGIASLVLGIVGFVIALVPCVGFLGIPLSAVGAVLGLVGVIIAATGKKVGMGIPLAGVIISTIAGIVPFIWLGAGLALGSAEVKKQLEEAKAKFANAPEITALELVKAYKEDAKKADEKYKDKALKIKGKIEKLSVLGIQLESGAAAGADKVTVDVKPMLALIPTLEKDHKQGEEITVGGKFTGQLGNSLSLSEAVIYK